MHVCVCVYKVFNDWPLLVYILPYLLTFSLLPLILLSSPATIQFLGNLKYDTVECTCCILFCFLLSPLKSGFDHITHGNWSCLSHQESLFCQIQWSISPHLFFLSINNIWWSLLFITPWKSFFSNLPEYQTWSFPSTIWVSPSQSSLLIPLLSSDS